MNLQLAREYQVGILEHIGCKSTGNGIDACYVLSSCLTQRSLHDFRSPCILCVLATYSLHCLALATSFPLSSSFSFFLRLSVSSFFPAYCSRIQEHLHYPEHTSPLMSTLRPKWADAGHEETRATCHSSLSSPISQQFHVVHKLSPSRARRTKVAELARHRRQRRPYGKGVTVPENDDGAGSYLAIV